LISFTSPLYSLDFVTTDKGYGLNAGKIYKTVDGGLNWSVDHTTQDSSDLRHITSINGVSYATGDNGTILKFVDSTLVSTDNRNIDKKGVHIKLYPNPLKDHFVIELPEDLLQQDITFTLFDIRGVEIKTMNVTGNAYIVKRGNLSRGIYFYQMKSSGSLLKTGKLSIQ